MQLVDSYRHRGLRKNLVNELIQKGIRGKSILNAIGSIPRHYFLDDAFDTWAYKDIAFPIDSEQTISQPYTVARQTELLELKKRDRVLEIGTGSGYQAAVLSYMGVKVYSIERQEELFHKTESLLQKIGFDRIRTFFGDGYKGLQRFAPFDKILVTCGASHIPEQLVEQLSEGGIMVIPFGDENGQTMIRLKKENGQIFQENHGQFSFVPMLEGVNS